VLEIISAHCFEAVSILLETLLHLRPSSCEALRRDLINSKGFDTVTGKAYFDASRNLKHNLSILIADGDSFKELN
jgi:ABC-type branched-subunit amino acid transport system substrate-binding protein